MLPVTLSGACVRRKGRTILGPLDLTLSGPGITAVIGPNGAGKSTLLRVLHGIERLSAGSCTWSAPAQTVQRDQSFVFQTPILLRRSVAGNLRYPLDLRAISGDRGARVVDWAARAGLSDQLDLPASRLSGGEKQKLALARALITDPAVLFLDEPCASLDGAATQEIEALLQSAAAAGTRIILATHDMGQVRRLASDIVFMHKGAILAHGTDLLARPPATLSAFLSGDILT